MAHKIDKTPYESLIGKLVRVDIFGEHQFIARLVDVRAQSLTALPFTPERRTKDDGKQYTPPVTAFEFEDHCPVCVVREDYILAGVPEGVALVFADMRKITMKVHYEID